jgi:hypothetical protein
MFCPERENESCDKLPVREIDVKPPDLIPFLAKSSLFLKKFENINYRCR